MPLASDFLKDEGNFIYEDPSVLTPQFVQPAPEFGMARGEVGDGIVGLFVPPSLFGDQFHQRVAVRPASWRTRASTTSIRAAIRSFDLFDLCMEASHLAREQIRHALLDPMERLLNPP